MIMPHVVRTVGRSTMTKQHQPRCSEEEFEPESSDPVPNPEGERSLAA